MDKKSSSAVETSIEDRLIDIVGQIETSKLSNDDKEELYGAISRSLHSIVLPILLKYVSAEELKDLTANPTKVTVESYIELMKPALTNVEAFKELQLVSNDVLNDVETALQKGGIV